MNSPRSYLRYEQPFQVPLGTARGVWKERVSWVFREHREGGRVSYGEIAPIPGLREISENEISPYIAVSQIPDANIELLRKLYDTLTEGIKVSKYGKILRDITID